LGREVSVYLVDATTQPRPVRIEAKSLVAVAAYVHEKRWQVRSIQYISETGTSDERADVTLRADYQPKSLATKIELTVGQLVIGFVLTIVFFVIMSLLLGLAFLSF